MTIELEKDQHLNFKLKMISSIKSKLVFFLQVHNTINQKCLCEKLPSYILEFNDPKISINFAQSARKRFDTFESTLFLDLRVMVESFFFKSNQSFSPTFCYRGSKSILD